MTFTQALRALEARQPTRMVPDLDRMRALSELLNHPQRTYPSIHITGTNGKTSTAIVATELLRALGLSVGTYTSPHLHSVRERIAYDGAPISEEEFAEALDYLAPYLSQVDAQGEVVTYFETLTMLAQAWFAERAVDAAVIEVGMGGEWDATNLIDSRVAVITEVAVDHPELGKTPVEIAREKVGIIKPGSIVVTGETSPAVLEVIAARSREVGSELRVEGSRFALEDRRLAVGGQALDLRVGDRRYQEVFAPVFGERLAMDALFGVAAVSAFLGDREIDDAVLSTALGNVKTPGRVEIVKRQPLVIVDGAHNPDAATSLRSAVEESFRWERLVLVLGILSDKDIAGVTRILAPMADVVISTRPTSTRAAGADLVAKEAEALGFEAIQTNTVEGAVAIALEQAGDEDCVLIAGSFYTVAEARNVLLGLT